jgi:small subunit ribosomal protein S6
VKNAGQIILRSGGVIRGVTNWGSYLLPKPFRKERVLHRTGHHFVMRFDSSALGQHSLRRTLGLDPRLLRYSIVKMGESLEDIKDVDGKVQFAKSAFADAKIV